MALAAVKKSKLEKATKTALKLKEVSEEETESEGEDSLDEAEETSVSEENESIQDEDEQEKATKTSLNLKRQSEEEIESEAEESLDDAEEASVSEENESNQDEDEQEEGNTGWADSIAKVLNSTKPKTKKSVVLSRAKKLLPEKEKMKKDKNSDYGFEIDGEIKEDKPDKEELKEKTKLRKNLPLSLRVRPTWKDIERERVLRKVATRGVVQLFNAVRVQQKDLQQQLDEAGPLDSRKDAVLNNINKRKFLDVLMSGNRAKSEAVDNSLKVEKEESSDEESDQDEDDDSGRKRKSEWSVLRPDYMTNKKIKHWDEEDEESDGNKAESSADSEDE